MIKVADKEELLRVLDENGNNTAKFEKRSIVHDNNIYHNEVALWVINKNKKTVLVQRRSALKKLHPNKIGLCAGHVVGEETLEEALFKEAFEEIGLDLNQFDVYKLPTIKNQENKNHCFSHHFYIFADIPAKDYVIQEEELSEVFYIKYKKFKKLIMKNHEEIAIKWRDEYDVIFNALDDIILNQYDEQDGEEIDDLELDEMNDVWDEMDEEDMI